MADNLMTGPRLLFKYYFVNLTTLYERSKGTRETALMDRIA